MFFGSLARDDDLELAGDSFAVTARDEPCDVADAFPGSRCGGNGWRSECALIAIYVQVAASSNCVRSP